MREQVGIAGSGVIACGLAVAASEHDEVLLWARSEGSAERARARVAKTCAKLNGFDADRVRVVTDLDALAGATFLVEAVIEHHDSKSAMLADLGELARHADAGAVLATTTSSLSIAELAQASGHPENFVGLHPFNPVPKMRLIELAFPPEASDETRRRARALCESFGKTPVEVPDIPGFVVNRLLFPYLFSAVELLADTEMAPGRHRQLHDARRRHADGPDRAARLRGARRLQGDRRVDRGSRPGRSAGAGRGGSLGRKTGRGFYNYR